MFSPKVPYTKISIAEGLELVAQGNAVVVDVRKKNEHDRAQIPASIWIPVDEIPQRHNELPRGKRLLFICRSGVRSNLAAEYAAAFGYDPNLLYSVRKSVEEWLAAAAAQTVQLS